MISGVKSTRIAVASSHGIMKMFIKKQRDGINSNMCEPHMLCFHGTLQQFLTLCPSNVFLVSEPEYFSFIFESEKHGKIVSQPP